MILKVSTATGTAIGCIVCLP